MVNNSYLWGHQTRLKYGEKKIIEIFLCQMDFIFNKHKLNKAINPNYL